ncbi:hypothetical protein [Staphylococcus rostri]|uniref:hypothetical protein n=1 Tax=Staphylococcus rostri TaxID=522262 RepID=UPI002852B145|nr:hypothetical protein [Staphylococcus rostri]
MMNGRAARFLINLQLREVLFFKGDMGGKVKVATQFNFDEALHNMMNFSKP